MNPRRPIYYGYIVVAAATLIQWISWGANRSFGVFLAPMLADFGWTRAGISGAFTLIWFVMGIATVFAGKLMDFIGPRLVLTVCGLLVGAGYSLTSSIHDIWQFYLTYGLIAGIGMSGCFTPLLSMIPRWFARRRALMAGVITAGAAFGISVVPVLCTLLIEHLGWRLSYLTLGTGVAIVVVAAAQFLKRDPGEMGLLPYGLEETGQNTWDLQQAGLTLKQAVRTHQFWLICFIQFGTFFLMNVITVHIVIHAIETGIAPTPAADILSVAAGVSIFARITIGALADRMGNKPTIMTCFILSVAGYALLLQAKDLWVFYAVSFLFGFGLWSSTAIMSSITADLFGLRQLSTIFSCTSCLGALGGGVGPVVLGYIYDVSGTYRPGFILCIWLTVIVVAASILLRSKPDPEVHYG